MVAVKLDGRQSAAEIKNVLAERLRHLAAAGVEPGLATVLVGEDAGSAAYVAGKHRDCAEVGMASIRVDLPSSATESDVLAAVDRLNADPSCTGYIVQLPLPSRISQNRILARIDPDKDADGLHPTNLGRLVLGEDAPLPCTPRGIVELLRRYDVPLDGAEVVVVGRGVTVGRPLGLLLTRHSENATVTLCHRGTRNLAQHLARADIVVAAAGSPGLIRSGDVRETAVVLDVGITRGPEGLIGDVDPDVREKVRAYAPMPGGVGPLTRVMLLSNVVEAAERMLARNDLARAKFGVEWTD